MSVVWCDENPYSSIISWSPTVGLAEPNTPTTPISSPASGWYVLTANYSGGHCTTSDSVFVDSTSVSIDLIWQENDTTLCASDQSLLSYTWLLNGTVFLTGAEPCLSGPEYGLWTLVAEHPNGCTSYSGTVPLCPEIQIAISADSLYTTPGLGIYTWSVDGEPILDAIGPSVPFLDGSYSVTVTMEGGCVVSAILDIVTSVVSPMALTPSLKVAPNPHHGTYYIELNDWPNAPLLIEITDVMGRVLYVQRTGPIPNNGRLEMSHSLPPGAYLLSCRADGEQARTRMIVE